MNADIIAVDRGERPAEMEPLLLGQSSRHRGPLTDLAFELAQRSAGFRRSLPASIVTSLSDLVRAMNCYYSNLIEGHDTHPVEIERALRNDYSSDTRQRDLQLEARAHMGVQGWIDASGLDARQAVSAGGILEIHRRFCELLPEDLMWVEDPDTGERIRVEAGQLRTRDVRVGRHVAVSPGAVSRFLERFSTVYGGLGKTESVIACAAAHHRLLWMHPFLDGNGRVARLMSHAMLTHTLETGAIWSVARGLARNVEQYKTLLANCDSVSEETLATFTQFFLEVCLDQVRFMESLVQPNHLRTRILLWAEEEARLGQLPPQASAILEAVLYRGELPRADVGGVVRASERHARRAVSALLDKGVLASENPRAPLRLVFPAALASRWMPGLFPEAPRYS